ncbi:competence protein CoiA family protein [Paenarthrobacter sp. C1]|uniref:competence protein CoiA family protein n=1 Tax=Paenarthrobacter sp. C1 TaxID=3400220 RepID=UPI003BF489F3
MSCPDCGDELVVRLARGRVPHFAHRPRRKCDAAKARARSAAERRRARLAAQRAAADVDDTQPSLFDLPAPDDA